jgi:hypothetical protein
VPKGDVPQKRHFPALSGMAERSRCVETLTFEALTARGAGRSAASRCRRGASAIDALARRLLGSIHY